MATQNLVEALVTVSLERHIEIGPLIGNRYSRFNVSHKNPRLRATANDVGVGKSLAGNISVDVTIVEFGRDMNVSVDHVLHTALDELSIQPDVFLKTFYTVIAWPGLWWAWVGDRAVGEHHVVTQLGVGGQGLDMLEQLTTLTG